MITWVRVPMGFRIGHEGEGFSKIMRLYDFFRALAGLTAIGMAEGSLAETLDYVKQRTPFGNPISKFERYSLSSRKM